LSNNNDQPEVIVVFVGQSLSSERMSSLAHSYEEHPFGGAFNHLKQFVETSKSSIVIPYAIPSSGVISEIISPLFSSLSVSSITIVDGDGSSINLKVPFSTMTIDGLLLKMQNKDWEIYNNGKVDVIIVSFPSHESSNEEELYKQFTADDAIMDKVVKSIQGVKYIGLFMSDNTHRAFISVEEKIFQAQSFEHFNSFERMYKQERSVIYATNWPSEFIEAAIVMIPFLFILFLGICCTFQLQSDLKFDHEKTILRRQ